MDTYLDRLILAPDLLEQIEALASKDQDVPDHRRKALAACLDGLDRSDRALIRARYEEGLPLAEAAEEFGKSHGAIRAALSRLRDRLRRCVQERLRRPREASS